MNTTEIRIHWNLLQLPGIGHYTINKLLDTFHLPSAILEAGRKELARHAFVTEKVLRSLLHYKEDHQFIDRELEFCDRQQIRVIPRYDDSYPRRLLPVEDAPSLLFYKGCASLDPARTVAVIGTRNHTDYGKQVVKELMKTLEGQEMTIVSGLAAGIDGLAHHYALQHGLPTIGVLGHGLDTMYPAQHTALAQRMTTQGGLLTEFPSGTAALKPNFPLRNRIVAGLSDFILVVETKERGGAMITARLGFGYNREVGAVPGNAGREYSGGCNLLIKSDIAHLVEHGNDILEIMSWAPSNGEKKVVQKALFTELTAAEQLVVTHLQKTKQLHFDELLLQTQLSYAQLSSTLLNLEMQDIIISLPGKRYQLGA